MGNPSPSGLIGMFEIDDISLVLPKLTSNFALNAGSSKHGKALRASVGSNCVTATYLKWEKFEVPS